MDLSKYGPLIGSLIQANSPMIATALQMAIGEIPVVGGIIGPLAGMALPGIMGQITDKLGLPANTPPEHVAQLISADPQGAQAALGGLELQHEQHEYDLAQRDRDITSQGQQVEVIKAEIAQPIEPGVFGTINRIVTTWWRPAVAWMLGGFVWVELAAPWIVWFGTWYGWSPPPLPPTRLEVILTTLGALLGLGAMRSFDKVQGTTPLPPGTIKPAVVQRRK